MLYTSYNLIYLVLYYLSDVLIIILLVRGGGDEDGWGVMTSPHDPPPRTILHPRDPDR